jgi:hypothetical protein
MEGDGKGMDGMEGDEKIRDAMEGMEMRWNHRRWGRDYMVWKETWPGETVCDGMI